MTRIVVLATGGTISSRGDDGGSVATDSAATLLGATDRRTDETVVEPVDLLRKNSFETTGADLVALVRGIAEQLRRPEVDGIVVTHGTDTLEESAFLADLVHDDPRPVVFTGAQRGADHPRPDGPDNLADAIGLASAPQARDAGVLVSFAGQVFAARGVQKAHTLAPAAFASRAGGPVGTVEGGAVHLRALPLRPPPLPAPTDGFGTVDVAAVAAYPGADRLFDAAVDAGARGVVVLGTGTGNPNSALVAAIRRATSAGVVVALGTRVAEGPVVAIYGGGGARDAVEAGAVPGGMLPASQLRVLLTLLLDHHPAPEAHHLLAALCAQA